MAFEFKLPDVGEGLREAEIVRWLIAEGDPLVEDQPMVEIQTDKAVVEIASPVAGTAVKLHGVPGTNFPVGAVLITIEQEGDDAATDTAATDTAAADTADTDDAGPRPAATAATAATAEPSMAPSSPTTDAAPPPRPVLAAPSTRRLARQLGVDLAQVSGSGPGGRITDQDVTQFATAPAQDMLVPPGHSPVPPAPTAPQAPLAPPAPPIPPGTVSTTGPTGGAQEQRFPLRGLRRRIAEQMTVSRTTIPHATHMDEVDVTELVEVRQQALPLAEEKGIRLTYLPFIIKAVVAGLRQHPELNATLDTDAGEIIHKFYYNIGFATDTADGLLVPVIKNADQKSIFTIATELSRLSAAARGRSITLADLQHGTFTITNIGPLGGIYATPVINPPEAAILAVHRIGERPMVHQGQIVARHMLTLSLAFDHRITDGATAARFLNRVMGYLAQPSLLFMELI